MNPIRVWPAVAVALLMVGCATAPRVERTPAEEFLGAMAFVRAVHPAPDLYVSADGFDGLVAAEVAELEAAQALGPVPPLEMARSLQRVVAAMGDAHILVGMPPMVAEAVTAVPILPKRVEGRYLVDASDPALPLGTEILAIDGRPMAEIMATLSALSTVDGARPGPMAEQAERLFTMRYHLAYGMKATYSVRIRRKDGIEETLTLSGVNGAEMDRLRGARQSLALDGPVATRPPGTPPWPFVVDLGNGSFLLRIPTFGIPEPKRFDAKIKTLFRPLQTAKTIAIDLRGNTGGFRFRGVEVLRHLLGTPFALWARITTRDREIPAPFRNRVSFPIAPEALYTDFPGERRDGRWVVEGEPDTDEMMPYFDAPNPAAITVFVDEATNSAAIEMLVALRANRPSIRIVGTSPQGECGRHFGQIPVVYSTAPDGKSGPALMFSLFDITLVRIPQCVPGGGVPLDVEITYTKADFMAGRDPYLDAL